MKHKHKNKRIITIAILLLLISIGFAYLTANLELDGLAGVKGNTWKIYFDNVEVYKGASLATRAPTTTGTNTTDLEYSVTLTKPGDVYKFYVDIVNAGSLDAMVNIVKVTNLTKEQKKFINYTVTYADETKIEPLNLLAKKNGDTPTKDTIVVTIEYKKDVAEEDLPKEADLTITEKLHLDYRQANSTATSRETTQPTITYDWNYNFAKNGNFADGLDYWTGLDGGTITLDNDIRYNGEPSVNVYTTTQNYSGIGNDYQNFEENKYPYGHDYLFHACFYKDSESPNGGVNQPIRMYIGVISSQGTNKYIGISVGTQSFTYIKDSLKEKEWVCFTDVFNVPDNGLDNKTNKSLRIDNHNQGLINNFWIADVQLRITDRVQYTYNTAITNFPDDPTRDGYTFEGWYTDPYGGTKVENTLVVKESQTLYAHWS